ncbi:MAG: acetyl-CoA carboxylase biotin carboxyl carrier protein [Phycisphaerae bacterium]|nr:acetyl-CoA carboxylase biotin carboxyl carrier protein [Phycisphaerae bacterium]
MDIDEIKTLTQLMVDNDLAEIIIRDGDKRIMLRRRGAGIEQLPAMQPIQPYSMPAMMQTPTATVPAPAPAPAPTAGGAAAADSSLLRIASPMVGTFYASANPESPPFVRIGDRVNPESVVCIIEAMKVFNEIKAEVAGVIESIEVQNGSPVEFNQVLMRVRPA